MHVAEGSVKRPRKDLKSVVDLPKVKHPFLSPGGLRQLPLNSRCRNYLPLRKLPALKHPGGTCFLGHIPTHLSL
jgi:hypothetical protein